MSISTRRGDEGQTHLLNGSRVSKTDPRLEACGALDELVSSLGLARSLCPDATIASWLKQIQGDLLRLGALFSGCPVRQDDLALEPSLTARLDSFIRDIENTPGLPKDWAVPGEWPSAAALELARAVCRRVERRAVLLVERGLLTNWEPVRYLNRLSDVLWLLARLLELREGKSAELGGRKAEP